MNNDDYGYFGKGTEGYIHYKQAFDESFKNNTPSTCRKVPQSKVNKRSSGSGLEVLLWRS